MQRHHLSGVSTISKKMEQKASFKNTDAMEKITILINLKMSVLLYSDS